MLLEVCSSIIANEINAILFVLHTNGIIMVRIHIFPFRQFLSYKARMLHG